MKKELEFPQGFLWGSACSSYQVEGGIDGCDWSKDFPAGRACDFWNRYEEYFDLAEELHQSVFRLSLEWSRIEPHEGKFDEAAVERYRDMLGSLRKRNIKTMVTLWHFTTPAWLSEKGGWLCPEAPEYFKKYVSFVAKELDSQVDFWITINEPMIYTSQGYILGRFPPRKKYDLFSCALASFNLARAHKKAYRAIKEINSEAKVAMAENYSFVEPLYKDPISRFLAWMWNYLRNRIFLEYTKKEQDFIGVNYYFHERIVWDVKYPFVMIKNANKAVSDVGTEIYPKGIYEVLKRLKKHNLPVYITENGLADAKDEKREAFIRDHLKWIHRAIGEGADIRGYLHWSLLDNFEWADGFAPRFGLVEMDYEKCAYKVRPSAKRYAQICEKNVLTVEE
jgi:beta-glucosidase